MCAYCVYVCVWREREREREKVCVCEMTRLSARTNIEFHLIYSNSVVPRQSVIPTPVQPNLHDDKERGIGTEIEIKKQRDEKT